MRRYLYWRTTMPLSSQIKAHALALNALTSRLAPVLDADTRAALEYATHVVGKVRLFTVEVEEPSLVNGAERYMSLLQSIAPSDALPPSACLSVKK